MQEMDMSNVPTRYSGRPSLRGILVAAVIFVLSLAPALAKNELYLICSAITFGMIVWAKDQNINGLQKSTMIGERSP